MKALMLSGVLAAGLSLGLLAPAAADDDDHRHSRHCKHRDGYSKSHRYYSPAPYYGYGYGDRSGYYNPYPAYGGYYGHRHHSRCGHTGYGYGPPAYVFAPPPPRYCPRPRVSIHLGF